MVVDRRKKAKQSMASGWISLFGLLLVCLISTSPLALKHHSEIKKKGSHDSDGNKTIEESIKTNSTAFSHHEEVEEEVNGSSLILSNESRVYFMKKVSGPGCPYTASWLAHINLYRKVKYFIDITKMEAASFTM